MTWVYCAKHLTSCGAKRGEKGRFVTFTFWLLFFFAVLNLIVGIHWLRLGRLVLSTDYGSGPLQPVGY